MPIAKEQFVSINNDSPPPSVGVLMLDTQFPRIVGDIGNEHSWPFPVRFRTVRHSTAVAAVRQDAKALLPAFLAEANALIQQGSMAITTSCGFLVVLQQELKQALSVPVVTSSLMQIPSINATLPAGKSAGVLTMDASSLSAAHMRAAGAPPHTPVVGVLQEGAFAQAIMNDLPTLDVVASEQENVAAAMLLVEQSPEVGAIVLECTNMVPYAASIQKATGLPVFSIRTLIMWLHSGLLAARFDTPSP